MRRSLFVPLGVLLACLVAIPACKKKDGGGAPAPASSEVPAAVTADAVLYAHINVKDVRNSAAFAEIKQAFSKAGGTAEWDQVEGELGREVGVKPTDLDSITVCLTELPDRGEPKFVLILTSSVPIPKAGAFRIKPDAKPDSHGFYTVGGGGLVHFPDDKTVAMVHPDLARKYLEGYAKDRSGWPHTPELSKAAEGHTLFATLQVPKIPTDQLSAKETKEFGSLLAAKTLTLTADLKDKQLSVAARATFADAAAAGKAKDKADELIKLATGEITKFMDSKAALDFGALMPAVKEAERALKEAKVEVSGSDLTAVASYKADFDFGVMVAEAVMKVRASAARMKAANNLKQIALALHNCHDIYNGFPVHGIGPNGAMLKNAAEKPLLSWRVAILPYIEQENLYRQFRLHEPWDSEHNKKLIDQMPITFKSPIKPGKPGHTPYQMVVGPNAMQPGIMRLTSITDGTSNTIAVAEGAEPVIWTKPDDIMLPGKELPKDLKKKFGGQFANGFNVAMFDGSVRFLSDSVSDKTLGAALSPNGGEVLGSDW